MLLSRKHVLSTKKLLHSSSLISSPPSLSLFQFPNHVASPLPASSPRLFGINNNHANLTTTLIYSRVPANSYSRSCTSSPPPLLLIVRPARPRAAALCLSSSPLALRLRHPSTPAAYRMFVSTERLSSAWRHTPMKWNPLPWFVGALLLILIQYRRYRSEKEVHVDEDGHEVIKLKGPWQVGNGPLSFFESLFCQYHTSRGIV